MLLAFSFFLFFFFVVFLTFLEHSSLSNMVEDGREDEYDVIVEMTGNHR